MAGCAAERAVWCARLVFACVMDALDGADFWSTSAQVIAGLVVALVFADVAGSEPLRAQVRWYGTLRNAAFVAIVGGLGASLAALADERLRTVATAVLCFLSVGTLSGLVGVRIIRLHDQARRTMKARQDDERGWPPDS
jgi:hypothetical protein